MLDQVSFIVFGQLHSIKNRKIQTRRGFVFKNPLAIQYEKDFELQCPASARLNLGSKQRPLKLTVRVYYQSWRSDVDIGIVKDMLQKCGVVSNDRWIRVEHIEALSVDAKNPRVEIELGEL
jgi:Holliday junction resolvase RusA-like endonuclease